LYPGAGVRVRERAATDKVGYEREPAGAVAVEAKRSAITVRDAGQLSGRIECEGSEVLLLERPSAALVGGERRHVSVRRRVGGAVPRIELATAVGIDDRCHSLRLLDAHFVR